MSDNNSKIEQRKMEARKRQQKLSKRAHSKVKPSTKKRITVTVCVLVVALFVGALFFSESSLAMRTLTAAHVGDVKVTPAEYSYYYTSSYQNYYSTMASYFGEQYVGIDTTKSLKRQEMSDGKTYAEYFSDQALNSLQQVIALSEAAEQAGYTLTEEEQESYDSILTSMKEAAANNNQSEDDYIEALCGKGFTMETYEKMLHRELMANGYRQQVEDSYEYSLEDLEAYYAEHIDEFAKVDYRYQAFLTSQATDDAAEVTLEDAKKQADEFLAKVTDEESYSAAALELAKSKQTEDSETEPSDTTLRTGATKQTLESVDANLADWAFDASREAGDYELLENASGTGYFVVYLVNTQYRDEYITRDARHILISVAEDASDEDRDTAKQKIEDIYQEWKDGEATEDSFAKLAEEYSNDTGSQSNGGLLSDVRQGEMVSEFDQWLYDSDRQEGDVEIVESSFGYHIIYYIGENDTPYWQRSVDSAMRSEAYTEWYNELIKDYAIDTNWLGVRLRTEPIG